MTDETIDVDALEVTQADRDAAASGYFAWVSGNVTIPNKMRDGRADDHSMVQAFARHRRNTITAYRTQQAAKDAEIAREARFLINRLKDLEFNDIDQVTRDYFGHVRPSVARLNGLLNEGERNEG